jgi:hypothetical protein
VTRGWLAGDTVRRRKCNHAPGDGATLVLQPVFCRHKGTNRAVWYRTALFASKEIAPFTELCYDYGADYWEEGHAPGDVAVAAASPGGDTSDKRAREERIAAQAAAAARVAAHAQQAAAQAEAAEAAATGGVAEEQGAPDAAAQVSA